jgi:uncharacterized SAM-binding protein YcdF (DUF218 family)
LLVVLVPAIVYALRGAILPLLAHSLDISEAAVAVDCVYVLGGNSETRPFVAAAMFRAGLTKQILVPTIELSPEAEAGIAVPEHDLIHRALVARGVPEQAIKVLPGRAASTSDEARLLAAYLGREPDRSVAIVTNGMHTRRAGWIFRRALNAQFRRIHFVAAPTDGYDDNDWWKFERGCVDYATEFTKVGLHWLTPANYR